MTRDLADAASSRGGLFDRNRVGAETREGGVVEPEAIEAGSLELRALVGELVDLVERVARAAEECVDLGEGRGAVVLLDELRFADDAGDALREEVLRAAEDVELEALHVDLEDVDLLDTRGGGPGIEGCDLDIDGGLRVVPVAVEVLADLAWREDAAAPAVLGDVHRDVADAIADGGGNGADAVDMADLLAQHGVDIWDWLEGVDGGVGELFEDALHGDAVVGAEIDDGEGRRGIHGAGEHGVGVVAEFGH